MTIQEIANTIIRGEKAITFPLKRHGTWISDANGHHLLDVRGWGFIQYLDHGAMSELLQDGIGDWVVEALNASWECANAVGETCVECGDPFPRGCMVKKTEKGFVHYEHFANKA